MSVIRDPLLFLFVNRARDPPCTTLCIVVLLRANVTVTGKWCCVTIQVAYYDSVAKSDVTLECRPLILSALLYSVWSP